MNVTNSCAYFVCLPDSLEAAGVTVWVDVTGLKAGVDFLSKIGQAIIDAKVGILTSVF